MRFAFFVLFPIVAAAQMPFTTGETTDYEISWRVFGAGTARMSVVESPDKKEWHATVEAHSTGFVSRLYNVQDIFRSTFHDGTWCSERLTKEVHEGARNRDIRIDFLADRKVAAIHETDLTKNREVRQGENPIPACAFDVVSGLYYLRTAKLEVGHALQIPLNDGGHTLLIDVEVQAKEEIKTPAGTFKTIRVEPHLFGGQLFKRNGRIQIWLTDDDKHRLVQLKARLFFGNITATAIK